MLQFLKESYMMICDTQWCTCPRGLVFVLDKAPRGQRALSLALAMALNTKSLMLASWGREPD